MARIATDPNYSSPTFPRATAGTDLFLKEDVQALAAAVSTHDHSSGKGLVLGAGAIPTGMITSTMIAASTILGGNIANNTITSANIMDGQVQGVDIAPSTITSANMAANAATISRIAVGSSVSPTTTSATYADIPDMTLTFTSGGPDAVAVNLAAFFIATVINTSATGQNFFGLSLDGGSEAGTNVWIAPLAGSVAIVASLYLFQGVAAASHTVKARWSTSAGTLTANQQQRTLLLVELRR